jgi:PIN domain nuclease of toxin-antitoxin system
MKEAVLDSYALLAYLDDEPGAEKVQGLLQEAAKGKTALFMSVVNWGEVYYSLCRSKGEERAEDFLLIIEQLPIKLVNTDKESMYKVARIKAYHSIALGDCFAAALAIERRAPVLTGDKEFENLGKMVKIEWL